MQIIKFPYVVSKEVTDYKQIELEAEELKEFVVHGRFEGMHQSCYAIHHAQVNPEPYNFFVAHPQLLLGEGQQLPHRVIINPKITGIPKGLAEMPEPDLDTMLAMGEMTRTEYNQLPKAAQEKLAKTLYGLRSHWPKSEMEEGCMSFPWRKPKKTYRFSAVIVEYDYPDNGTLKHIKVEYDGLLAHIFQHECEHAEGKNIYFDK